MIDADLFIFKKGVLFVIDKKNSGFKSWNLNLPRHTGLCSLHRPLNVYATW